MKENPDRQKRAAALRGRAETRLSGQHPQSPVRLEVEDSVRMIHELQVHEIELEMQNEELVEAQVQLEALRAAESLQARVNATALLARYTELYDSAPVGYVSLSPGSAIVSANLAAARLLGFDRASLLDRRFDQFVSEADRPRFERFLQRILRGQVAAWCEVALLREDSQPLIVQIEGTPSSDRQQCRAILLDITERRKAEARLHWQAALLDAASDAIYIQGTDGKVRYWNRGAERVYGWSDSEALGQGIAALVQPDSESFELSLAELMKAGNWCGELNTKNRFGETVIALCRWSLLQGSTGASSEILAIHTDITARKQLEAEVLQAQKMEIVGRLAGGIAHDFNNLLTLINGTADLMLSQLPDSSPLRTDLQDVRTAGERAASLTQQLLVFSRKQVSKFEVLNLSAHLGGMQDMLRRLIGESISVSFHLENDLWNVLVDRTQIEQVVMNLVVNSRDAMTSGGRLTIQTRNMHFDEALAAEHSGIQAGPHVMLSISDTGVGMDEATRARVFEPFFTTKEQGKGTGLGLSTVYGIVRQSGGSVLAEGAPGQGSTFSVYLPRVDAAAEHADSQADSESVGGTETILVVEDEEGVRRLARRILESAGYKVLTAGSGTEALEVLARHDGVVDLVFTDLVMPGGMTGRDLVQHERLVNSSSKVLITSGYFDQTLLHDRALDTSGHFVAKPYTARELLRSARAVLDS